MRRVYTCLTEAHDPALMALATVICLLGALLSLILVRRLAAARGWSQAGWLLLAGVAGGAFVWCTHFIGMLAYQPGLNPGFLLPPTMLSLLLAAWGAGAAFALATRPWRHAPLLGGLVFGLSVGVMHYTGMAAYGGGVLGYDPLLVGVSLLLGMGCGAVALPLALRRHGLAPLLLAAFWLGLAVVLLHLVGMAALTTLHDGLGGPSGGRRLELGVMVATVGLLVLFCAAAAWMIDLRGAAEARERLRRLANSSQQGLAVTAHGRIVEANDAFIALSGQRRRQAVLGQLLPGDLLTLREATENADGPPRRIGSLRQPDGSQLEVEVTEREGTPEPGFSIFAFSDLRERREHERRIMHLVTHDALTGLPNRARFSQRLEQILRRAGGQQPPQTVALLHLGLDHFKAVNDLHGHAGGDSLLRAVGRRLADALPPGAFAARLGADEFGVALPFATEVELFELISRLEKIVAEPSYVQGEEIAVSASMGVALFPADTAQAEELRAFADFAMRRAKQSPGRGLRFYQPERDELQRTRLRMAGEMRTAMAEGQFRLFAQVQMDVRTGLPCGHEMLLRWQHPERGMVSPAEFIPVAEENGMILPIGDWVLREACQLAQAYPWLGKVAVNLSAVQLGQANLPQQVAAVLRESGLPATRLELEITESTLMRDIPGTVRMLEEIQSFGVDVVMDDFGTGYSSLATLQAFPFRKIKLDRGFLARAEDSEAALAILRAVIGIGRGLHIPVLAEGVETESQLALLRAEGCDEVQGFLFGRPQPVSDRLMASVAP